MQPTGETQPLASEGGEYTDYVYKNQYSAVAEGRALSGVKTYDGYYLSFAEGYLCDEINHYSTLLTATRRNTSPAATSIPKTPCSNQALSYARSSARPAPGTPAPKLEGAGFTVYRVWDLSKVSEFQKNADGTYNVQSILDAYRKDNYDNTTSKYDFSGENQAIARMFELNASLVAEYNASLTAAQDYANGQGDGLGAHRGGKRVHSLGDFHQRGRYLACDRPAVWPVSGRGNDVAQRPVPGRPVCGDCGQQRTAERHVPAGRQRDHASNSYLTYNVLNEELEGYLQLIKDRRRDRKAGQNC